MQREIKFRAWDKEEKQMWYLPNYISPLTQELGMWLPMTEWTELMQFTGLKDKNGKEIYEGDVIQLTHGTRHSIVYYRNGFHLDDICYSAFYGDKVEIIGNIYENPDLLKA